MGPRDLTEEEPRVLSDVTALWKRNRDWMDRACALRLDSADPAVIATRQLAERGERFVVFAGKAATSAQISPRPLQLTRLSPKVRYRTELINRADAPDLPHGDQILRSGLVELSRQYRMIHGLTLPWSFPDRMWVIEGQRL